MKTKDKEMKVCGGVWLATWDKFLGEWTITMTVGELKAFVKEVRKREA
jgi:hypothetical protein